MKWTLDNTIVTTKALNRAKEKLKTQSTVIIAGNRYCIEKDEPTCFQLRINDYYIFSRFGEGKTWYYWDTTIAYKRSCIPDYTDKKYLLTSDSGNFVINDLAISNGVGDGVFSLIVRTIEKPKIAYKYHTHAEIYHKAVKLYPLEGKCTIAQYDCQPTEKFEFDNVYEIQVVDHKIYVIRYVTKEEVKNDN